MNIIEAIINRINEICQLKQMTAPNNKPKRKLNRLKNYDYSQEGAYFVTICTKNHESFFGAVENGQLVLNKYGLAVQQEIKNISTIRKECTADIFVVMPNHIHLIVQLVNLGVGDDGNRSVSKRTISNMVQGLKGAVTRQLGFCPWQRSFYDHIIRNEQDYIRIAQYIQNNPLTWKDDCYFAGGLPSAPTNGGTKY